MNPHYPKYLPKVQLEKLSSQRLLQVLNSARAAHSFIIYHFGWRCCEMCHEYVGENYERDIGQYARPLKEYMNLIKSILALPKHKKYDKRKKK